jgi:hypothetical protein
MTKGDFLEDRQYFITQVSLWTKLATSVVSGWAER